MRDLRNTVLKRTHAGIAHLQQRQEGRHGEQKPYSLLARAMAHVLEVTDTVLHALEESVDYQNYWEAFEQEALEKSAYPDSSVMDYPWTKEDYDFPTGTGTTPFVSLTKDKKGVEPANMPKEGKRIYIFSGSWAAKTGVNAETGINYQVFAHKYIRNNLRDFCQLSDSIKPLGVVYPMIPEAEQQLIGFRMRHDSQFTHPHLETIANRFFEAWCLDEDGAVLPDEQILENFKGQVMAGYSYGCLAISQVTNYLKRTMQEYDISEDTIRASLRHILSIMVAPTAEILEESARKTRNLVVASPFDRLLDGTAKAVGGQKMVDTYLISHLPGALRSAGHSKLSSALADALKDPGSFRLSYLLKSNNPVRLTEDGNQVAVFPRKLPTSVAFDEEGNRKTAFKASNYGHDRTNYVDAALQQFPAIKKLVAQHLTGKEPNLADILCDRSIRK